MSVVRHGAIRGGKYVQVLPAGGPDTRGVVADIDHSVQQLAVRVNGEEVDSVVAPDDGLGLENDGSSDAACCVRNSRARETII